MLETVLQTSGSDIVSAVNLVISGVAALAALLVLWFTALKGPDISLVSSHSKVEYKELLKGDLSLTRVEFEPIDVVFANDGSRSGALIEINTAFKPSRAFEPYFWIISVTIGLRSNQSLDPTLQLPQVIPDRGTLVVTINPALLLKSWKDGTKLDQIRGDMSEALKTIWKEGHELLKRFTELDQLIGTFQISVRKTTRRRLRTTIDDSIVSTLVVPPLPEWIREEARKYITKFSDIYPTDDQAALLIRKTVDIILTDASRNSKLLEITYAQAGGQQLSTQGWDQWFGTWRSNYADQRYRAAITRNEPLTKKIVDYYQSVMKYNKRVTATVAGEGKVLESMRLELKKMSDELAVEVAKYQQILVEATEHLLPVVETAAQSAWTEERLRGS
jgi:hypothetical protein